MRESQIIRFFSWDLSHEKVLAFMNPHTRKPLKPLLLAAVFFLVSIVFSYSAAYDLNHARIT